MPANQNIFSKYKSKYFVETGSYIGNGIQSAIDAGFENIISIELSENYYNFCIERFNKFPQVKIIRGDSIKDLYGIIKNINDKITFWLDGHYSGGNTAISETNKISPLLEELSQIKNHKIKNHNILIDDLRCWKKDDVKIGFGLEEIKEMILNINLNYIISFEDGYDNYNKRVLKNDILVSYIK